LKDVFEPGHAYVGLSRAKSLDGSQVLSFNPHKCMCDPRVVEFYAKLMGESYFQRQSGTRSDVGDGIGVVKEADKHAR